MSPRSSPVTNNVEGPWRCADCGLEFATYAEAIACENKHVQENDRRYEIKMVFETLLYNQEDLRPASNDIKVITDILKGGGTATATTTILQSKELLFDYLDNIRNEIFEDSHFITAEELDKADDIIDLILNTALEMDTIRPQQPRNLFSGTTNATTTMPIPTFSVGVAPTATNTSMRNTTRSRKRKEEKESTINNKDIINVPTTSNVGYPPMSSVAPITINAPKSNTGYPPMSSLYYASMSNTTKTETSDASLPPVTATTAPSPLNAFSKKEEAKPTVKSSSTVVPPSLINGDSLLASVTSMSTKGKYACLCATKSLQRGGTV